MPVKWNIVHRAETKSTNDDAAVGVHGDVFTADYQVAGRGRIGHKWVSPAGANLLMSAVLDVSAVSVEDVCTLPLVAGFSVVEALVSLAGGKGKFALKWPNDVFMQERKVAGILCERKADFVIVGIGVNVLKQDFPKEIASKAAYLGGDLTVEATREAILKSLSNEYFKWLDGGFAAIWPDMAKYDFLKGKVVSVHQVDDDKNAIRGICGGILPDGTLDVGGEKIYAGETHIEY